MNKVEARLKESKEAKLLSKLKGPKGDKGDKGDIGDKGDGTNTYYECSPSDVSSGHTWSNITSTAVTGTSTAIGTGKANTALIMAQPGHTDSAAKLCHDLATD